MKIAILIAGALVLLIAVVLAVGAALPRRHSVTRSIFLARKPADVYALTRDFANAPRWRSDVKSVEVLDPVDGRQRFREHSAHGAVTYEVTEDIPSTRLATRILDQNLGYSGSWTYSFAPENQGTRLSITEDGEVSNVLFRFLSRFVFGHAATIDRTLSAVRSQISDGGSKR